MEKRDYIEAGRIVNTHGVAGEVKIEVWLDSPAFLKRFPRLFIEGRAYTVSAARVQLPPGTFFLQDILGAKVQDEQGREIGILVDVLERPASNIYVVRGEEEHLIPAVPAFIKRTDPEAGIVTVHLIEGM